MGIYKGKSYTSAESTFGEKLAKAYPDLAKPPETVFEKIAALDPTSGAKDERHRYLYLTWICSRILHQPPRAQDIYKIHEDISLFATLARLDKVRATRPGTIYYNPFVQKSLDQYASITQLSESVLPYQALKDRKKTADILEEERREAEANTLVLYNGPEGRIVSPQTMEAAQYWGKGTKWCISATKSDNLFDDYHDEGRTPVLMFLPKGTNEKFAFNESDNSSARNVLDVGVYDAEFKDRESASRQAIFEEFFAVAVNSPSFKHDIASGNPALSRALSLFCLYNPPAFIKALEHTEEEPVQAFMDPDKILGMVKSSLNETSQESESLQIQCQDFITNKDVLTYFSRDIKRRLEIIDFLKDLPSSTINKAHIMGAVMGDMSFGGVSIESKDDWVLDYAHKAERVNYAAQAFSGLDDMMNGYTEKTALKEYLDKIPQNFWGDEAFCAAITAKSQIPFGMLMDIAPQIFEHPKPWVTRLEATPDSYVLKLELSSARYTQLPFTNVDGVPFLQSLLDAEEQPFCDLASCQDLYDAFSNVDGVDWSPLATKLEQLYPEGFEDVADLEAASGNMPKCDLTKLLEKSVKHNPAFFADVDPDRQTIGMVTTALNHDPECLADVADRFFNLQKRPPEMAAAFKRMVDMKSPYIAMVERHFSGPSLQQPA